MTGLVEHLDRVVFAMGPIDFVAVLRAGQAECSSDLDLPPSLCDNSTLRLRIISIDSGLPNYPRICSLGVSTGIFIIMNFSSTQLHGATT